MDRLVLGRTNAEFPSIWLRLGVPDIPAEIPDFVASAQDSQSALDVTCQPALWGRYLDADRSTTVAMGGRDVESAHNSEQAADFVQAHLLQTLCGLRRESIDAYFLVIRRALEEYQIDGALQALEAAREEGHVRFVGLSVRGLAIAALGTWQFHDGFELIHFENSDAVETLGSMAIARRVGVVSSVPTPIAHARLVAVSSVQEIGVAVS